MNTAEFAQTNLKLPVALKTKLQKAAKAKGTSLTQEVVFRCTVEERLKADLAAGKVPAVEPIAPAPAAPAAAPMPEPAMSASYIPPDVAEEAFQFVHDLYQACIQDHADVVIPNRLGQRAKAFITRYPRAAA